VRKTRLNGHLRRRFNFWRGVPVLALAGLDRSWGRLAGGVGGRGLVIDVYFSLCCVFDNIVFYVLVFI